MAVATKRAPAKKAGSKKATSKKATAKKRRPMTAEGRAKLAQNLVKARAARAAKAKANPKPAKKNAPKTRAASGPRTPEAAQSQRERSGRTRTVKAYLEYLRDSNGTDGMSTMLSGIPGIKGGRSNDPDLIERAADIVDGQIAATGDPLKRLKMLKRVRNLRELVERLRSSEDPTEGFVREGAQWCTENGYDYTIMRDIGVPAAVLKEAGVE